MPSFTIPGLSSGQNTNDLVKKLVEVEAKPIKRWEKENEHNKIQVRAWTEFKNKAVDLQIKTKNLTSFTAPFSSKKITANEEGYISGEAGKNAKVGKQEIEILQLATKHKIAGNKVKSRTKIPEGNFTIISKDKRVSIQFSGGEIEQLSEKIRIAGAQVVKSTLTRVDNENVVLSLSATQYGKDAELKFLDPSGVLAAAGLVGPNQEEPPPTLKPIEFSPESPVPYLPEKFPNNKIPENITSRGPDGYLLKPSTAFQFLINRTPVERFSSLELMIKPSDGKFPDFLGCGVVYETKEGEKTKYASIERKENKYTLNVYDFAKDETLVRIIVANTTDSDLLLTGANLVVPGEITGATPTNVVVSAQDAIFKIDGIEIKRDTNEMIKDAIEGASINLLKPTPAPITLEVVADTTKAMTMLREFVESYNNLIKYSRDITATNKDTKIDLSSPTNQNPELDISEEYWSNKAKSGILAGEATIIRLLASLRATIGASYPSSTEPRFKVLADIGITTGEPGSSWKEIQEGFLTINETVLQNALIEYPESVRELFASDTNGDNRADDGVGIAILENLKPYVQFTSGIVSTKIRLSETMIQENNKKIKEYESHLVNYERKLKQKFEYMEQGLGKNKAISNYLNQSIKQMRANNNPNQD